MAIAIEGYTVVAQRKRIQPLLEDNALPEANGTALCDDQLWRCSFMTHDDAIEFAKSLALLGLNTTTGPDSDVVIVNEFDGAMDPYCEWLTIAHWDKAVIGWLTGTNSRTVVAREGWDPKVGSGLQFTTDRENLELLRLDGNVEVFLEKSTGREVYIGHPSPPVRSLYELACKTIRKHLRTSEQPPIVGEDAEAVTRAVAMLEEVIAKVPDDWAVHWFHGKGRLALGNVAGAYDSFRRAFDLEKNNQAIGRELSLVCLDLGKFQQAVQAAEHAVALQPDDCGLLSNLALAYLLSGRTDAACKTIDAAVLIDPNDAITRRLHTVITDTASGKRAPPKTVDDLFRPQQSPPPSPMQKRFWQFWK